jgi:ElaB/YqjD/DUF883 family membrane-anchored ribosome-binding protein
MVTGVNPADVPYSTKVLDPDAWTKCPGELRCWIRLYYAAHRGRSFKWESAMDENQVQGGSGPALAAHSKDASTPGQTPASSAKGNDGHAAGSAGETVNRVSEQAREAAARMSASVSDVAGRARQGLSEQGSWAANQGSALVREQPFVALALTGAVCLMIGILLGRR